MVWLLKNWRFVVVGILIAGAVFLAWHYKATLDENERLQSEIQAANTTIKALDDKARRETDIRNDENALKRIVRNAPDSDNAPVAPVLDAVIDSIDRMHE